MGNIRNFHFLLPTFLSFTFGVLLVLCLGFGPAFTKLSQNSFDLQGKIWSLHFSVQFVFSVLCVAQSLGNGTVLMSRHEEKLCFSEPALYNAYIRVCHFLQISFQSVFFIQRWLLNKEDRSFISSLFAVNTHAKFIGHVNNIPTMQFFWNFRSYSIKFWPYHWLIALSQHKIMYYRNFINMPYFLSHSLLTFCMLSWITL